MSVNEAMAGCAIAVMAKAPRPGAVKTRLCPPLTLDAACALSTSFLRDMTENIVAAAACEAISGHVAYAPAGREIAFAGLLAPGTRLVLADGHVDMPVAVQGFGRSLLHAARSLFAAGYDAVCLLNSDSPTLPTSCLVDAARALTLPGDHIVLGTAEDGGYYLLGMTRPHAHLFEDIAWSTDQVAHQTRARASALGLHVVELEPWYDVDDATGLRRLVSDLSAPGDGSRHAPYRAGTTAACLKALNVMTQALAC